MESLLRNNSLLSMIRNLILISWMLMLVTSFKSQVAVPGQSRRVAHLISHSSAQHRRMFSGIVEEMGVVNVLEKKKMEIWDGTTAEGVELTVSTTKCLEEAYLGCSIAVNGVCLTATSISDGEVSFGLAPETLRRTNLGSLTVGNKVNLERALQANSRNSGHFVQGHVDCTGKILQKWKEDESLWVKVSVDREYARYVVPKGFISVDGTSLTICDVSTDVNDHWFTFMLVAHTQKHVIIPNKEIGDHVNLEFDVLAKMVERSMDAFMADMNRRLTQLEQSHAANSKQ